MDGGAWWAAVHGVSKSRTRLSDFTFTFHFHALEKEMATHSSVLAWRIPGTGKPAFVDQSQASGCVASDWLGRRTFINSPSFPSVGFPDGAAASAAAKSLQSCPTVCDLIYSSPPGSPIPGILQARTLECVAISFSNA